ncbi:unnamed protein product [Symbiodinium sp. CCMP2456]|nr:unnamed protein product [Symbiodinium sp. CCMP2456]
MAGQPVFQAIQMMMEYNTLTTLPENWLQTLLHVSSRVIDYYAKNGELQAQSSAALRKEIKRAYTSCVEMASLLHDAARGQGKVHALQLRDFHGDEALLQKVGETLSQKKPLFIEIAQMGGTNHYFVVQEVQGQVVVVDAWQNIHPLQISSSQKRSEVCKALAELLGNDPVKRDLAALQLFGKDHGFKGLKAHGQRIRLKAVMHGEPGSGLQLPSTAARRRSMDGLGDALVVHGRNGQQLELPINRAHSLDEAFPCREPVVRTVDSEVPPPELRKASGARKVAAGAAAGAAFALTFSLIDVFRNPAGRTTAQKVEDVLVPTAIGAAEGGAAAALLGEGVTLWGGAATAGVAVVATGAFVAWDAIKLARGTGTTVQLRRNFASNAGGAGGGIAAGALSGAAAGVWLGPVGAGVCGLVGGIAGAVGGAFGGSALDQAIWDSAEDRKQQAVEFFGFKYTRWQRPTHISAEALQKAYNQTLARNDGDQEWLGLCKENFALAMALRWQEVGYILDELQKAAEQSGDDGALMT